jgi:diketogulonate reductase-like aldo/keto reductase
MSSLLITVLRHVCILHCCISRCNPEVSWMHCENAVDKEGLWIQSYMAMERAYAEGRVASLGVSNFDIKLLLEMAPIVNIVPHVVQNFAEVGNMDLDVRVWCSENGVVFMPYSTQQDLSRLHEELQHGINVMSQNHGVSPHVIVTRFFLQTGAAMIPRTTNLEHMLENLETVMTFQLADDEMHFLGWPVEATGHRSDEL